MRYIESLPEDLSQYESELLAVVRDGLSLFVERYGKIRATMSARSQASSIHDCMVEEATRRFPQNVFRKLNLFMLRIETNHIKLKKLDKDLLTRNYPTQLVFDFLRQLCMFGSEPHTNLHLGYQVDPINLEQSPVYLTKPKGRKIEWAFQFDVSSISIPVPAPEEAENTETRATVKVQRPKVERPNFGDASKQVDGKE
jgi:hypothetical protein